ncbi:hypothetical protein OCU04_009812 [Sclerotinia nivalis]|uniref:Uncharacterized protein n=1 Tax=Sclerotinia nivalis TaxID=352851 RepID=A0A9X0AFU9_9HELO|nr:hypothetical protein OCU04_009812 [Sclerotinia nivalis]
MSRIPVWMRKNPSNLLAQEIGQMAPKLHGGVTNDANDGFEVSCIRKKSLCQGWKWSPAPAHIAC